MKFECTFWNPESQLDISETEYIEAESKLEAARFFSKNKTNIKPLIRVWHTETGSSFFQNNHEVKRIHEISDPKSNTNQESEEDKKRFDEIILTTETVCNFDIEERLEIITAECVFGMNIFRDLFATIRDIAGGRSEATQKVLKDLRVTVLTELRKEAYRVGANAVVGVDLDYSEFSGGGKSMLFLVASGTAVKIAQRNKE